MVCQPIKMLICWLLLTSQSVHGDVVKTAIFVQNVIEITRRPLLLSGLTYRPAGVGETSTVPKETSSGDVNESYVTASHDESYDSISAPPLSFDDNTSHQSSSNLSVIWGGSFTSEEYESMTYVVNIVTVPVALLGVLANLVTIRVYMRMPRSVTSTFFCLVTAMDVIYLLTGLPSTLMHLWLEDVLQDSFFVAYSIYVNVYFAGTLRKVIVCVTMMLSVDRVLLVAFPFRTKTHTHLRRPKLYTLIVAAMAYLLDSHILFRDKVSEVLSFYNATEDQVYLEDTCESQTSVFFDLYLVSGVLFQHIPLALLVISNVLLVVTLVRHSRRMKEKLGHHVETDVERSSNGRSDFSFKTTAVATISYNCDSRERINDNTPENRSKAELDGDSSEDRVDGKTNRPKRDEGHGVKEGEGRQGRKVTSSWGSNKRRKALAKCEKQHSVMVLIYSFFFTLLALPSALFPLFRKLIPGFYDFGEHHFLVLSLYGVFFLLNSVSSAMNFLVCFLTGSAFRQGVSALCVKAAAHRSTLAGLRSG